MDWIDAILAVRLLLDPLDAIATLLAGSAVALADTAAEGFLLLGRVCCGLWFAGRDVGRDGAAGRSFRAVAVVDFGFEGGGFFFDDAEAALDGVVGGACELSVTRICKVQGWRGWRMLESLLHTVTVHGGDLAVVKL